MSTLCIALSATLLSAQTADLEMSVTSERDLLISGERFTIVLRVRNHGPDASSDPWVTLSYDARPPFVLSTMAPAGWTCLSWGPTCTTKSFAAGSEASFTVTLLAPTHVPRRNGIALINPLTPDPLRSNNTALIPALIDRAPARANLRVQLLPRTVPAIPGARGIIDAVVQNKGPDAAPAVFVRIVGPEGLSASGSEWTCDSATPLCQRGILAPGETTHLRIVTPVGRDEERMQFNAWVHGERAADDDDTSGDFGSGTVTFGTAENYELVLIPLTVRSAAGAFGSRWSTELSMVATEEFRIFPRQVNCAIPEGCLTRFRVGAPFDPVGDIVPYPNGHAPGTLLYTDRGNADKLHFTLRIRDLSNAHSSWGTQIPVVRERDFRTGKIVLSDVPLGGPFRSMLRLYDPDRREDGRFVLRYIREDGTTASETVRKFDSPANIFFITPALLPLFAAYSQIDISRDANFEGTERLSIEIEPAEPGQRIWGFVSVTSNVTQHVTIIAPN